MADADVPDELIRAALVEGFALARDLADGEAGGGEPSPIVIPPSLERVLGFTRLSDQVLATTRRAMEADQAFRAAVAERLGYPAVRSGGAADVAAWLWLCRPDGWESVLAQLAGVRADLHRTAEIERDLDRARTEIERLGVAAAEAAARAESAEAALASHEGDLRSERKARHDAEAEVGRLRAGLEALQAESSDQLARVSELEGAVDDRDRTIRSLEVRLDQASRRAATVSDAIAALDLAGRVAGEFTQAVVRAQRRLKSLNSPSPSAVRQRREPVNLPLGIDPDSIEGVHAALAAPGVHVVVDGYNVTLRRWSDLRLAEQRARLVGLVGAAASRFGFTPVIVFDGNDDRDAVTVRVISGVRVEFTPAGVEADERIVALCHELEPDPVVVVTSDNEVRDHALARGANLVHADAFVAAVTPSG